MSDDFVTDGTCDGRVNKFEGGEYLAVFLWKI